MPGRERVLDIIDNCPVWDSRNRIGRNTLLKRLDGGTAFRYMAENIFPMLRNGAFIRVYYSNTTDSTNINKTISNPFN